MREREPSKDHHHDHKHKAASAGPSADDRYGPGFVAQNLETRIIAVHVVEGRTRITIARGTNWGVHVAMEGYVKAGLSMVADFQIDEVHHNRCHAFVDVTPDQLKTEQLVVINPTSKPRTNASAETPPRMIGVWAEGGRTKIILSRGFAQGVTFGTRGDLRSTDGRNALSFVIDGVSANQSFAYVKGTVQEVNAHPQVVLHGPGKKAPVQRRANGTSSTADVQTTANAGVASASSPLPHLDAIQRSFGKHDVSGIRAQVGGAATSATSELGARAYATGDRVAFASTPDLHTAAHEAAHVIQQQRGAVGFQGLGAADDEHEHHADAVADAVVAGKSAEPLLDQIAGGARNHAIQRKEENGTVRAAIIANTMWDIWERNAQTARNQIESYVKPESPPVGWAIAKAILGIGVDVTVGRMFSGAAKAADAALSSRMAKLVIVDSAKGAAKSGLNSLAGLLELGDRSKLRIDAKEFATLWQTQQLAAINEKSKAMLHVLENADATPAEVQALIDEVTTTALSPERLTQMLLQQYNYALYYKSGDDSLDAQGLVEIAINIGKPLEGNQPDVDESGHLTSVSVTINGMKTDLLKGLNTSFKDGIDPVALGLPFKLSLWEMKYVGPRAGYKQHRSELYFDSRAKLVDSSTRALEWISKWGNRIPVASGFGGRRSIVGWSRSVV